MIQYLVLWSERMHLLWTNWPIAVYKTFSQVWKVLAGSIQYLVCQLFFFSPLSYHFPTPHLSLRNGSCTPSSNVSREGVSLSAADRIYCWGWSRALLGRISPHFHGHLGCPKSMAARINDCWGSHLSLTPPSPSHPRVSTRCCAELELPFFSLILILLLSLSPLPLSLSLLLISPSLLKLHGRRTRGVSADCPPPIREVLMEVFSRC